MARHVRQIPISTKNSRSARMAHARATREFRTYDTSAIVPKRSKAPSIIALAVILIVIAAIVLIFVFSCTHEQETLPPEEQAVVIVSEGESASEIASTLYDEYLIGSERKFMDLVEAMHAESSLIPGTYLFAGGTSVEDIVAALMEGPESTADKLTVPEGATRAAIAQDVAEATGGRITADQFLEASADASVYAASYPYLQTAGNNSLEGFLFPKTYPITATDEAADVVRMMLDQFGAEISGLDFAYPEKEDLNLYQTVILASIVQKEGVVDNYRTVASVFYNRLNLREPYLQSDATTAYEVGHDPTAEEVHADTPYSTYSNEGLPPTPICNPSIEALQSVCSPEDSDYLYFYSYKDGTYAFSETYSQHQRAIQAAD